MNMFIDKYLGKYEDRCMVICECGYTGHNFIVSVNKDKKLEEYDYTFTITLSVWPSFWKRLLAAFKYVFKRKVGTIEMFDCINANRGQIVELIKFLQQSLCYSDKD